MKDKELVERLRLHANCMMDEWESTLSTVAAERDRYKAERENTQPLTLEELRRMDGEVVYIPESEKFFGGTGIVSLSRKMVVDVEGSEYGVWPLSRYGAGWLAYRSKPKRSE